MTVQADVASSSLVAETQPLIYETMPNIAHPQIRNRGTFGGSLAHADPASELPVVATTLNARFKAQSTRGERWIEADEFFITMFTTALEPDEVLTEIAFPAFPQNTGWSFMEVTRRRLRAGPVLSGTDVCPNCRGLGRVVNPAQSALSAVRDLRAVLAEGSHGTVEIRCDRRTASALAAHQERIDGLAAGSGVEVRIRISTGERQTLAEVRGV